MKNILITGANSGIGLESVKQFLIDGWKVIAISKNINNLNQIVNENLVIYKCDVSNYLELSLFATEINNNYNIDVVINNAGVAFYGDFNKITHKNNEDMLNTNIIGFTNIIELFLPGMQLRKNGTIVNISSLADRNARPGSSVYAASKAYVKSLSESLRADGVKYNIRVTNLAPTNIDTPLLHSVKKNNSNSDTIPANEFVRIIKFIVNLPQEINVRDLVIAPTSYEK